MAMPLNEGDSATMPVDEEPAPAPAPTISEILAAAVATGGAGGAASSNSLMVTAPEEDEYDDDDALSTGSATAVPKEKGAIVKRPWTDEEERVLVGVLGVGGREVGAHPAAISTVGIAAAAHVAPQRTASACAQRPLRPQACMAML